MQDTIKRKVRRMLERRDPEQDFQHIIRVCKNANPMGQREEAIVEIRRFQTFTTSK